MGSIPIRETIFIVFLYSLVTNKSQRLGSPLIMQWWIQRETEKNNFKYIRYISLPHRWSQQDGAASKTFLISLKLSTPRIKIKRLHDQVSISE